MHGSPTIDVAQQGIVDVAALMEAQGRVQLVQGAVIERQTVHLAGCPFSLR